MAKLFALFLSFILGVGFGMGSAEKSPSDSELKQKVQDHMDIIVDESAGIVDDVVEEIRKDERVQKAEKFAEDVNEIVDNTMKDIDDHFGSDETESAAESTVEEVAEAESVEEAAVEE